MPTIELTDEQAEELRDVLSDELISVRAAVALNAHWGGGDDPDIVEMRHRQSVLSDILELLEIA
jgi:hypothetical protein